MSSLGKVDDQYRIRYRLYLPDGKTLDRSRRVDRAGAAKSMKAQADIMESMVKRQTYTADDVARWIRDGLLARKDGEVLRDYQHGGKTLARAVEEYRRSWAEIGKGEQVARDGRVNTILEILGGEMSIHDLRHSHGEQLKTELRARGLKAVTVNKHIQDLKRIASIQVAERALDFHPFAAVKGLRVPTAEKINHTIPTSEQIQMILAKAEMKDQQSRPILGGHLTLFLLLLFGCGLRRSEALAARLENIDWEKRGLMLTKTKTGKPRLVGLGKKLFSLLLPRQGETGFILPQLAPGSVSRAIKDHFAECGLTMRLHDTRHTYTTMLQDHGVAPMEAMGRTGHADMRMLSHYSHPQLGTIHEDEFSFMQEPAENETEKK